MSIARTILRIPEHARLRIVGDVHGDARALAVAAATDRFVVQLGDLVDNGPDSAGALRVMFELIDEGRGLFLLGNHDYKLGRVLSEPDLAVPALLATTLAGLDDVLRSRAAAEIARAPAWICHDLMPPTFPKPSQTVFVHGGFHTAMLHQLPPTLPRGRAQGVLARALYGEPTGRLQADGYPERSLRWVDRIPPGVTVYCGHDQRSADGRPYVRASAAGGAAVFLDTGAGKGGHLSWIDLPAGSE